MKILAEFNGKKCYIVDTFVQVDSLYCVIIIDGIADYALSNYVKVIDENYLTK